MTWQTIAGDGQRFALDRPTLVRYGQGTWIEKLLPAGSYTCDTGTFGDPGGSDKRCQASDVAPEPAPPAPAPAPPAPAPAPSPAPAPAGGTMPPLAIPAWYVGADLALVSLEREVPASDLAWMRAVGLRVDWSYGHWTVMRDGAFVGVGHTTPADAVAAARRDWQG